MNRDAPFFRIATFHARRGCADRLAEQLLQAATLVDGGPEVLDGEPLGGARAMRGTTGAARFAILDAPDLSRDPELLGRYELGSFGVHSPGDGEMVTDRPAR